MLHFTGRVCPLPSPAPPSKPPTACSKFTLSRVQDKPFLGRRNTLHLTKGGRCSAGPDSLRPVCILRARQASNPPLTRARRPVPALPWPCTAGSRSLPPSASLLEPATPPEDRGPPTSRGTAWCVCSLVPSQQVLPIVAISCVMPHIRPFLRQPGNLLP